MSWKFGFRLIISIALFVGGVEQLEQTTSLNHESRVTNSLHLRFYSDKKPFKRLSVANFTIIVD